MSYLVFLRDERDFEGAEWSNLCELTFGLSFYVFFCINICSFLCSLVENSWDRAKGFV